MMRHARIVATTLGLLVVGASRASGQVPISPTRPQDMTPSPKTGEEVLERMRSAHAKDWYKSLTMDQTNTTRRPNGSDTVQSWHAVLQYSPKAGTRLRIDTDPRNGGSGTIFTIDSTYLVRQGRLYAAIPQGDKLLVLLMNVYLQPVATTLRELAGAHVNMSRVKTATLDRRDVWIVGAKSPADSYSPQFWIDVERKVVVRMIVSIAPGQVGPAAFDTRIGGYVPSGNAWVATKIERHIGGVRQQADVYSSWKVGVPVDPRVFLAPPPSDGARRTP